VEEVTTSNVTLGVGYEKVVNDKGGNNGKTTENNRKNQAKPD
jgi:hypothetical protein